MYLYITIQENSGKLDVKILKKKNNNNDIFNCEQRKKKFFFSFQRNFFHYNSFSLQ